MDAAPQLTQSSTGFVYLVGGGPGDPGLLTLRGKECLQRADLVLYDGLVNPLLLCHTRAHAERTCRNDAPSGRVIPQAEINQRLIDAARAGKVVVRLKGGDPFIFGRGSEEAAALAAAGIGFEIVPGITAATAAAVYTGISLTHREHASAVAFVTGHEEPGKASSLDYHALAQFPGTLVFYMGLHRLELITQSLIAAGKSPETPCCVVSRATQPQQKTVIAPLRELAIHVRAARLHAPSLVIVGDCVRVRDAAQWFESRPLFGQVIAIARSAEQADETALRVWELGAQPLLLPTIEILPPESWTRVDQAIDELHTYDWLVLTSVNGVNGFLGRLWSRGMDLRRLGTLKLAAIGPATAKELHKFSLRADLIPDQYRAEALAAALAPHCKGQRVLWARANRGRDVLPAELTARGAHVDEIVVYQNRDVAHWPPQVNHQLEAGEVHWIALSSPSIARNLARLLSPAAHAQLGLATRVVAISPVTHAAAVEAGLPVHAEAAEFTWEGIFQAIIRAGH